jgi:hypothetical protein
MPRKKTWPGIRSLSYGGVGKFYPSSEMKKNSMIGNGVNFVAGHYQSLTKTDGKVSVGVEARISYSKFEKALQAPSAVRSIRYENGSGAPVKLTLNLQTLKKNPDAFHYLIGPSVLLSFDKFFLQPSLLVGYSYISQEAYKFYDNIYSAIDPSKDTVISFFYGNHETNKGFGIVPGLKAGVRFHKNIAAFISADYSMGPKQKYTDYQYFPAGTPDPQTGYDYFQVTHGTVATIKRESKLKALMVNFNVAFVLPYKK